MKAIYLVLVFLMALPVLQADQPVIVDEAAQQKAAERINLLDKRGYIPPSFKMAVHAFIDAQIDTQKAKDETAVLKDKAPALLKQATDAQAQLDGLQKQWDALQGAEEAAYSQVQALLKDSKTQPDTLIAQLQSFIWSYPRSAHLPEIQQDLTQAKQSAVQESEDEKKAEVERLAAREKLLERVAAKNLSLDEWQRFLDSMSEFELLSYLGHPDERGTDYWLYKGTWTVDPTTNLKSGLRIEFNGGRVMNVSALLPPP